MGADVLMFTDPAPRELGALERAPGRGRFKRVAAEASNERILALKRQVG